LSGRNVPVAAVVHDRVDSDADAGDHDNQERGGHTRGGSALLSPPRSGVDAVERIRRDRKPEPA